MLSMPLLKQTIKANWMIWGVMTAVSSILLAQFAAMELTQSMLFVIFYSMLITIFPAIYSLISSNKLLANQVDRGSMAYILSTPKSRKVVVTTQVFYSIVSTVLMFTITAIVHCVINASVPLSIAVATSGAVPAAGNITTQMIIQVNASACLASLAVAGVCYLFSGIFNRSKYAIGCSGTIVGVCIIAGMMGMFGALGVKNLDNFKYLTLFSLYDYNSILVGAEDWIMKGIAAAGIALAAYVIGSVWFCKKDLPL